jgi:hypothetical protein
VSDKYGIRYQPDQNPAAELAGSTDLCRGVLVVLRRILIDQRTKPPRPITDENWEP